MELEPPDSWAFWEVSAVLQRVQEINEEDRAESLKEDEDGDTDDS